MKNFCEQKTWIFSACCGVTLVKKMELDRAGTLEVPLHLTRLTISMKRVQTAHLNVAPTQHDGIHLLQSQLGSLWHVVLHKGKTLRGPPEAT